MSCVWSNVDPDQAFHEAWKVSQYAFQLKRREASQRATILAPSKGKRRIPLQESDRLHMRVGRGLDG